MAPGHRAEYRGQVEGHATHDNRPYIERKQGGRAHRADVDIAVHKAALPASRYSEVASDSGTTPARAATIAHMDGDDRLAARLADWRRRMNCTVGADVTVYERSKDRTQPRGAGIVMQPEAPTSRGGSVILGVPR